MTSYEVLKNRLTNGRPYTVEAAVARITALADALEITQDQANELTALAQQYQGAGDVLLFENGLSPDGLRRLADADGAGSAAGVRAAHKFQNIGIIGQH